MPDATGRMLDWLEDPQVVAADGRVVSWVNVEHPGYPYQEIAGLLLSLLSKYDRDLELRERIASGIAMDTGKTGAAGRWNVDYAFDSAMALSGLIAHRAAGGLWRADAAAALYAFVRDCIQRKVAIRGHFDGDPNQWSVNYGCHLLKLVLALDDFSRAEAGAEVSDLVDQLVMDFCPLSDGGRFRIHKASDLTYLHAHCYAIEGLLRVRARYPQAPELIQGGTDWLASIQQENGSIRAFHDGHIASGDPRADATAQAVRIWTSVDSDRYLANIRSGVTYLLSLQDVRGGLQYGNGSGDINTWCTIFAVQAVQWAATKGQPTAIV